MEIARKEWKWIHENPFKGQVTRPKANPPRSSVFSDAEIEALCLCLGDSGISGKVKDCFLFALETAMRAGEIVNIQSGDLYDNYVKIRMSKNGFPRDVPLSSKASSILDKYRNNETVFGITSRQLDANFRRAKKLSGVDGHFHDARRTALTRLAKIYTNPMDLAKISGHKDLSILLRVYYAPTINDLAEKMNATI